MPVQGGWWQAGNQGTRRYVAIVFPDMTVNPDPKPGRWILPLVVLGMVAFTYFFMRELPEASPDTTLAAPTTTTIAEPGETTEPGDPNGNDTEPPASDYLSDLDEVNTQLQTLLTEMIAVNEGFDADPREIEYSETESRMEEVAESTQELADQVTALTPPPGLESNHDSLQGQIELAAAFASDALEGLRSADTGELRRSSVQGYTQAVENFDIELINAHNAAAA